MIENRTHKSFTHHLMDKCDFVNNFFLRHTICGLKMEEN